MAFRRSPIPQRLAWLLIVLASYLTYLNGVAVEDGCESYFNCSSCLNSTSSCQWLDCKDRTQSRCTNQTNNTLSCIIYDHRNSCLADPNTTTSAPITAKTSTPVTGNTTDSTSPKLTTTSTNATVTTTAIPGTHSPRISTFDASSFIGGIVLVLGLQAVIFFLYKFCKSKDQNYHTL